jgi:uncharacterized protein YndB with AHSA1/START domain
MIIYLRDMNDSLKLEAAYNVSLLNVWKALTEVEQLKKWYFPQIIHFEPKVGEVFMFTDDGSPYQKEWKVTRLENNRLLAHSWSYKGYPGNSEVIFELFRQNETTVLRLTHTGLASFPVDPHFDYQRFEQGWEMILGQNLRRCLEDHSE